MPLRLHVALLFLANALIPIAIWTFAKGFFPYKPFLPGYAVQNDIEGQPVPAPFEKAIFMVVDALRSDFVYSNGSGFKFTQSLIRTGAALPFTAHATSPTITMPRIKAMTTGSTPSFLDLILNFAESDTSSSLATQDTWPGQLRAKPNGKLVMFGDDTWLKLFPSTFSRADGTSSFFVSDFTEVDNNVTRHLPAELANADWNGMFMHYLGLDHIGHKSGPRSPHMLPKQKEMDGIVKKIFRALQHMKHLESTLLVLCGDHGMNNAGNHGGSAPSETSPALVFISPKLSAVFPGLPSPANNPCDEFQYYTTVEQSDLAPTLAGLLGFPVPLNSLGVFIPELLPLWPSKTHRTRLLEQNAHQMRDIVKVTFGEYNFEDEDSTRSCEDASSDGERLHCRWVRTERLLGDSASGLDDRLNMLTEFLRDAQAVMSGTASNYDILELQLGVTIATLAAAVAIINLKMTQKTINLSTGCIIGIAGIYGVLMFASSYVEEEHHFWYWITCGWLCVLYLVHPSRRHRTSRASRFAIMELLITVRIVRRWNQTGQKYAGAPDIGKTFLPQHNIVLWTLVGITFLEVARRLVLYGWPCLPRKATGIMALILTLAAVSFKLAFAIADAPELLVGFPRHFLDSLEHMTLISLARTVFAGIGVSIAVGLCRSFYIGSNSRTIKQGVAWSIHDLLSVFLITQTRVTNIPLFLLFYLQLQILGLLNLGSDDITLTSILFQYASFFAFGGSNAISSVDLSNGYNGIDGYNVLAVGILTFASNWAGPIWWASATNLLLLQADRCKFERHVALLTLFVAFHIFFVMLACSLLKTHLFIWTVFSPKYLFSMAWSLGQHACINILFSGLHFWFGSPERVRG